MSKVGLVIDSTTILSPETIAKYKIEVVSLNIVFGEKTMSEIETTEQFIIDNLNQVKDIRSSSPSPYDFQVAYDKLFNEGYDEIIVVPLSKGVSGTYQTAVMAKDLIKGGEHVFVVDTDICNFGVANLVETMLPFFDGNHSGQYLFDEFQKRATNTRLLFTITEIKHLIKSGRISRIAGTFAEILHIKPIIKMIGGKLVVFEKTRSNQRMIEVFLEQIKELVDTCSEVSVKIVALQNAEMLKIFAAKLKATFANVKVTVIEHVNPVFLTHLGNNGFGISATGYSPA